ncbi:Acetoacetyl-CoA synthetase [Fonsecaea pedrosoi]|nr:Acetoacetyl-CoA synthetase [Fonsecaea pedrosoi]
MAAVPAYRPPPGLRTRLHDFRDHLSRRYKVKLASYENLHKFSITRMSDFWTSFWDYFEVIGSDKPAQAIDENARIDEFPTFFQGAKINFAENVLARKQTGTAIINMREGNMWNPEIYTWQDLEELVKKCADALKASGLQQGEVVTVVGGNNVRSLALLLATGALGALFSSFATDIGDKALEDRLKVLEPRILIAETVYSYNGNRIDISGKIANASRKVQLVNRNCELIVVDNEGSTSSLTSVTACVTFDTFLGRAAGTRTARLEFQQVEFSTPFIVMFSSGTTGAPKGIVHSHGIGWTLWNISLGALLAGSKMVLYDGSPFFPSAEGFLKALFSHKVTSFGAGPRYFSELQKLGLTPRSFTSHLHTVISTGALLPVPLAAWLVEAFGPICQINMSGGTELCGSFVNGTPALPSYPGQCSTKALGCDVAVFGPDGTEVEDGQSGELVCRRPFPNMPVMLLKDPGRKRYFNAYFAGYPHVWTHGDFAKVDPETGGIYVLGRSDGVLNPSGVRFGSSDIYNVLLTPRFSQSISDACVVGQQRSFAPYFDSVERVVLFVKCTPSYQHRTHHPWILDPDLEHAIRAQISRDLSRRHVPTFIFRVPEVPYNANGKKLEIQVKAIVSGGRDAFEKLKATEEERKALAWFLPFYHIENVVKGTERPEVKL